MKNRLEIWSVYKLSSSGKLMVRISNTEHFQDLNSDLSFSTRQAHRVKRSTGCVLTPYRIEVEITYDASGRQLRHVRSWNENTRNKSLAFDNKLLEHKINVSPSSLLNEYEIEYVGAREGSEKAKLVLGGCVAITVASMLFFELKLNPALLWFSAGTIVFTLYTYFTNTSAPDPIKLNLVQQAKERVRSARVSYLKDEFSRLDHWTNMTGIEFERAVKFLFEQDGYEVQLTPRSYDKGVDLIMKRHTKTVIVQCKAHKSKVGVGAVRELAGVKGSWPSGTDALLVTVHDCTKEATDFAKENKVGLYSIAKDYLETGIRSRT